MISFGKMSPYDNDWEFDLYNGDYYFESQYHIKNINMKINKKSSKSEQTGDNLKNQQILNNNYII